MPNFQSALKNLPAKSSALPAILTLTIALLVSGCSGSSGSSSGATTPPPPPSTANEWTWEGGSSTVPASGIGQPGVYGTQGVAAANNVPGGRTVATRWTDSSGIFWLFGGDGVDSAGKYGGLSDLWQFNTTTSEWTWESGSSTANAVGVYGTQGAASANNIPGSRAYSVSWTDSGGNLWLFGGEGRDSNGYNGLLNDLWEYNPAAKTWAWVSGSIPSNTQVGTTGTFVGPTGVYGSIGTAATTNVPGGRWQSVSWTDSSGNFWLFGGTGYDSTGTEGELNDLWEFNTTTKQWTWINGSNTVNVKGNYGTLGVSAASNVPGSRDNPVSWTDKSGNLWLFGGNGYDSTGASSTFNLNDLWSFSTTTKQWTWVSGSNTGNTAGVYGTLGVASAANVPGPRYSGISWLDSSGNLWLSGGIAFNLNGATESLLNDLWEFNPTTKQWIWMSGASTPNAVSVYGTLGVSAASTVPGARFGAVSWTDSSGDLWLFGGSGDYNSTTQTTLDLNDLWRYQP
jgi:N-acetylneuraminic acid mutarotase